LAGANRVLRRETPLSFPSLISAAAAKAWAGSNTSGFLPEKEHRRAFYFLQVRIFVALPGVFGAGLQLLNICLNLRAVTHSYQPLCWRIWVAVEIKRVLESGGNVGKVSRNEQCAAGLQQRLPGLLYHFASPVDKKGSWSCQALEV